jgi:hypothetical protein
MAFHRQIIRTALVECVLEEESSYNEIESGILFVLEGRRQIVRKMSWG